VKIRIETVHVPAETYEVKHLGCDHCDYETTEEDNLKNHHAKNHAVKKEQTVNGEKFYWFDSEEDAKLWVDPPDPFHQTIADFTHVQWDGPGWYGTAVTEGIGRCRCGGCSYWTTSVLSIATFIDRWRKAITANESSTEARLQAIEAALKLETTLTTPETQGEAP
jgi:hypothetical protein